MHLESLQLANFKNYPAAKLEFSQQINCFLGKNGSGKTNLLDGIFYLSFTKSAFPTPDQQCILHQEDFFSIKGTVATEEKTHSVLCAMQQGKKKLVKLNDVPYKKASEHVGKFPAVMIAPNDTDVIRGGSEDRRKFFDAIIAQADALYLQQLIEYNHTLKQRNSLLKQFAERDFFDADLLQTYTEKLITLGEKIYEARTDFIASFAGQVKTHYANLSEKDEEVDLTYESHCSQDLASLFKESLKKDLILKRTNIGIHKDDFHFLMDDLHIKKFGSQGQQKSFLIALKMANFDYLFQKKGTKPLLLLDDIFDKLDDFRIKRLIEMVASETFGQIFVTDARPERTIHIFEEMDQEVRFFEIDNGTVKKTTTKRK